MKTIWVLAIQFSIFILLASEMTAFNENPKNKFTKQHIFHLSAADLYWHLDDRFDWWPNSEEVEVRYLRHIIGSMKVRLVCWSPLSCFIDPEILPWWARVGSLMVLYLFVQTDTGRIFLHLKLRHLALGNYALQKYLIWLLLWWSMLCQLHEFCFASFFS